MESNTDTTTVVTLPAPNCLTFEAKRDGKDEIILVNEALLSFVHTSIFPWYLSITLNAKEVVDNGMPSASENELLFAIGDVIEETVLSNLTETGAINAQFLSRSTRDGVRELSFYVHDPKIMRTAIEALVVSRPWERAWNYQMAHDPQWMNGANVFQLFPQARGLQS